MSPCVSVRPTKSRSHVSIAGGAPSPPEGPARSNTRPSPRPGRGACPRQRAPRSAPAATAARRRRPAPKAGGGPVRRRLNGGAARAGGRGRLPPSGGRAAKLPTAPPAPALRPGEPGRPPNSARLLSESLQSSSPNSLQSNSPANAAKVHRRACLRRRSAPLMRWCSSGRRSAPSEPLPFFARNCATSAVHCPTCTKHGLPQPTAHARATPHNTTEPLVHVLPAGARDAALTCLQVDARDSVFSGSAAARFAYAHVHAMKNPANAEAEGRGSCNSRLDGEARGAPGPVGASNVFDLVTRHGWRQTWFQ